MKKLLGILVLVGLIGGGFMYWYTFHKPHRNVEREKAAFSMTADELFNAYDSDESAANEKYLDQVIELEGTIMELSDSQDGRSLVVLEAEAAMLGGASIRLAEGQSSDGLETGQSVKLKARCVGMDMEVKMEDGYLQ